MLMSGAVFGSLMIIKLLCVFASIPIAIIGFKRSNKVMALSAVVLIFAAYGLAEMSIKQKGGGKVDTSSAGSDPLVVGKTVYMNSCINCHGADGKLGGSGAKDLSVTMLSPEAEKEIIRNGKNSMPANKDLTAEQVDDVIKYISTLK